MALLEIREAQRPMAPALMCAARSEIPARVAISATVAGPSASASSGRGHPVTDFLTGQVSH